MNLNVRMGKKDDLSNFELGLVVGTRRAGLSISQSAQFTHNHFWGLQRMV